MPSRPAALLSDVEGGGAVADELVNYYGADNPRRYAVLTYTNGESEVGIGMSTVGGDGPNGRFGCETGSIVALDV